MLDALDLLTPEAQAGAYEWASVLLAHFAIGLALVAVVSAVLDAMVDDWLRPMGSVALVLVVVVYAVAWEGLVQRYGAGLLDAGVDTLAVAMGGLAGLSAWLRRGALVAASLVVTAGVAVAGVWRRR